MIDFDALEEPTLPVKPEPIKRNPSLVLKQYEAIIYQSETQGREEVYVYDKEYKRVVFNMSYNVSKRDTYLRLVKTNYTKIDFIFKSHGTEHTENEQTDGEQITNIFTI